MRREELTSAVQNVAGAFDDSGVSDLLQVRPTGEGRKERSHTDWLDTYREFFRRSANFGGNERRILEIFELTLIEKTGFWLELGSGKADSPSLRKFSSALARFRVYTPQLISLLENEAMRAKARATGDHSVNDVISVVMIEERGFASKPTRVVDAIRSVSMLYEVCAQLRGADPDTLAVIGCDSGSDKSFDFLGVAAVVKCVKELIIELWDRAVFFRQTRTDANLNAALKTLSIVDEIAKLQNEGKLEPEHCERLKHQAVSAASMFLSAGLFIPEVEQHTTYNPRVILAPQPKLLTGSPDSDDTPSPQPHPQAKRAANDVMSEDEEAELRRLMEKARRSQDE